MKKDYKLRAWPDQVQGYTKHEILYLQKKIAKGLKFRIYNV